MYSSPCNELFINATSNTKKLAMLSAWQSTNSKAPIIMDYAPGSKAICIDTGASSCISNDRRDFITYHPVTDQIISGISSGLKIEGRGTLRWLIRDDLGNDVILHVSDALHVPNVPLCLLCPQQVAQQTGKSKDGFYAGGTNGVLTYDGFVRTIPYNGRNGLPLLFAADPNTIKPTFSPSIPDSCTSEHVRVLLASEISLPSNTNLSRPQRKLLHVHERLGHIGMDEIQQLARNGYFGESLTCIGSCDKPLCHACCLGKAHKRPISVDTTPLKATHLRAGDCVSCDQLESNTPGRVATLKGKPSKDSYHACTFFIDHASNKVHITLNYSTGAAEATHAKHRFEKLASEHNISIRKYHGDNGVFATQQFKSSCEILNQRLDFSGVGAKHQNGVAERMIGTITRRARTMLLHAIRRWPDTISEDLWPFALKLAVDIHNSTPTISGLSPDEIFSGQKSTASKFKDFHPFGCPVFVLEASLQDGHRIPKWKPRSRMAIYLGNSPDHATTVPLVLNPNTGLVSPQYHLVFDDNFSTTECLDTNTIPTTWPDLFKNSSANFLDPDLCDQHTLHPSWNASQSSTIRFVDELDTIDSVTATDLSSDNTTPTLSLHSEKPVPPIRPAWNQDHPYSTRFKRKVFSANTAALESILSDETTPFANFTALLAEYTAIHSNSDGTSNSSHHFAFAAANEDTLHYGQMRQAPDRDKFEEDMRREVADLLASGSVTIVRRASMPADSKAVPAIWSFRRKRAPDWSILKWKARLCPHGGKQIEGINFWETYAPVVTWSTTRLILILSLITGMKSRQIDYIQAYTQAPVDCEVYMHIPAQFIVHNNTLEFSSAPTPGNSEVYVLLISKNLYGLRQAGNNWFDKLRDSLLSRGFSQSSIDPCLFIRKDIILIVYVDDCLLFAKNEAILDSFISSLQSEFNLTCDGDVGAFLGIQFTRVSNNQLTLTQPGLISKIVKECGLDAESKRHNTPAVTKLISKDSSGPQREHAWNYRMIVGMLTYLSMSSRPDIAFAVNQCARFSTCPMRIHEIAIRRICRYLQATSDQGYVLHPTPTHRNLDCYVDADFAGLWTEASSSDSTSVKSRTGYVILFANCPVLWVSKLQTEVALSTTEAEYIALSQAMRDLIPMRALLTELSTLTCLSFDTTTTFSTVFEDNKGCVELANAPKMRPRTKHIALKYHHFRSHVASGDIKIRWIDTKNQLADIFTKPLPEPLFTTLRLLLLGW